jgi:hypothetical protein
LEARSNIATKRSHEGRSEKPERQQLLLEATEEKLPEREPERDCQKGKELIKRFPKVQRCCAHRVLSYQVYQGRGRETLLLALALALKHRSIVQVVFVRVLSLIN